MGGTFRQRCGVKIISEYDGNLSKEFMRWESDENKIAIFLVNRQRGYFILDRRSPFEVRKYMIGDIGDCVIDGDVIPVPDDLNEFELKQEELDLYPCISGSEDQRLKAVFILFLRYTLQHSALLVDSLVKIYKNGHKALKGISFYVNKGDFLALLGSNGAGKSTAINIITGLLKKTSGKISVYGNDTDSNELAAKSLISLVPQEINFHPYETPSEILINQAGLFGIKRVTAKKEAEKLLLRLGLYDIRDEIIQELSGGIKRQLMIARALITHPKVLLLDEPTAGIDIEARHRLWEYLREVNSHGTTIILTTHHLEEAEFLCNRFVIIQHGRILADIDMKILMNLEMPQIIRIQTKFPLQELFFLEGYSYQILSKFELEIKLEPMKSVGDILSLFFFHKIEIANLHNRSNKLEELFLAINKKGE